MSENVEFHLAFKGRAVGVLVRRDDAEQVISYDVLLDKTKITRYTEAEIEEQWGIKADELEKLHEAIRQRLGLPPIVKEEPVQHYG